MGHEDTVSTLGCWGRWLACVALAAVGACGEAASGPQSMVRCGEGTTLVGDACVAVGATTTTCGPGTARTDGACLPTDTAAVPSHCGEGTVLQDGECVIDPSKICPDGTLRTDTVPCAAGAVLGKRARGLSLDSLTMTRTDEEIPSLFDSFPVRFSYSLSADDAFETEIVFGFALAGTEEVCVLGGQTIQYTAVGESQAYDSVFPVPTACRWDLSDDETAVVNLWAWIDPVGELEVDEGTSRLMLFDDDNVDKPQNAACELCGLGDTCEQGCAFNLAVKPNPGTAVSLEEVAMESAHIKIGGPHQSVITNLDGELVYSRPDLVLNATTLLFGQAAVDAESEAGNALVDDEVTFDFAIRPTSASDDDWQPLYLHVEGDPAKAGGPEEMPPSLSQYLESVMIPQTPHYYHHGLYIEDDCGTTLDPDLGECDGTARARTKILGGDWASDENFLVRTCLTSTFAVLDIPGLDPADQCRTVPVSIERVTATEDVTSERRWDESHRSVLGSTERLLKTYEWQTEGAVDAGGVRTRERMTVRLEGADLGGAVLDVLTLDLDAKSLRTGEASLGYTLSIFGFEISSATDATTLTVDAEGQKTYQTAIDFTVSHLPSEVVLTLTGAFKLTVTADASASADAGSLSLKVTPEIHLMFYFDGCLSHDGTFTCTAYGGLDKFIDVLGERSLDATWSLDGDAVQSEITSSYLEIRRDKPSVDDPIIVVADDITGGWCDGDNDWGGTSKSCKMTNEDMVWQTYGSYSEAAFNGRVFDLTAAGSISDTFSITGSAADE